MTKINWNLPKKERDLVDKIVCRAKEMLAQNGLEIDVQSMTMDIVACHNHSFRLRLKAWLDADCFDFLHDIVGIRRHMDRRTGLLTNCFVPRFWCREVTQ